MTISFAEYIATKNDSYEYVTDMCNNKLITLSLNKYDILQYSSMCWLKIT